MTDPRMPDDDQFVTLTLTRAEVRKAAAAFDNLAWIGRRIGVAPLVLIELRELEARFRGVVEEVAA